MERQSVIRWSNIGKELPPGESGKVEAPEQAEAAGTASGSSKSALLEAIKARDRVAIRALLSLNSSQ